MKRRKLLSAVLVLAALMSLTTAGGFANAVSPPNPAAICGYLPVGSFATGIGWGDIYTNGSDVSDGTAEKFINGYEGVGVSCGILGGYVQFDMGATTPISNNANNKYGVDFIIYGNSLGSNPEPGIVMVATDVNNDDIPDAWYELTGSLYYDETQAEHGHTITYIRVSVADDQFDAPGIWYAFDYYGDISSATWIFMNNKMLWWPEYEINPTTPYYSRVVELDGEEGTVTAQGRGKYVIWNRTAPYEIISYRNITVLNRDVYDQPEKLQFGYFDVTPNGADYGIPVNPYGEHAKGGDGYDLSWAVNACGYPVSLSSVRYVRLYTGINVGKGADMSSEVQGLYTVSGGGSGPSTSNIEVWTEDETTQISISDGSFTNVAAGSYTIYADNDYVYVNGDLVEITSDDGYTVTLTSGSVIQIIAQSGTESPYITGLRCL